MNPYCTVEEAQDYFDTKIKTEAWDLASNDLRLRALCAATRAIDQLGYAGAKTVASQEREFPRNGQLVVPDDIKNACCECASSYLEGYDAEQDFRSMRIVSQAYGQVRLTYGSDTQPHLLAGIPSVTAWRFLQPYLRDVQAVKLCRV